jgi:hypothetical protein
MAGRNGDLLSAAARSLDLEAEADRATSFLMLRRGTAPV